MFSKFSTPCFFLKIYFLHCSASVKKKAKFIMKRISVGKCGILSDVSKIKSVYRSRAFSEAFARRCSVKKVFLEISQNSQENTCARVSFLMELLLIIQWLYFNHRIVRCRGCWFKNAALLFVWWHCQLCFKDGV